jgi:hypothetical protein
MIPTFLARASTLLFNQLWLWRIHQCVPSFQPGPVLSLLPGITDSPGKIRHDFFFPLIQVQSSPQPPCSTHLPPHTISKTHSKHIAHAAASLNRLYR